MEHIRTESIEAPDGGHFNAHVAIPAAGRGAGVLLIQEVFGVNEYVRDTAQRLAELGYVVMAPDVFWRTNPGFELDSADEANIGPAVEVAGAWDPDTGLADLQAAFDHLHDLPETTGAVAVMGFCFGGTQALRLALTSKPACAVSYYGSGVVDMSAEIAEMTCPTMFHFGDSDSFIPNDKVDAVVQAASGNPHATVHIHHGAGHAFDNRFAPHFSQPDAAESAWTQTLMFLFQHIGGIGRGA